MVHCSVYVGTYVATNSCVTRTLGRKRTHPSVSQRSRLSSSSMVHGQTTRYAVEPSGFYFSGLADGQLPLGDTCKVTLESKCKNITHTFLGFMSKLSTVAKGHEITGM